MELLLSICALIACASLVKIAFFNEKSEDEYSTIERVENKEHVFGELDEYIYVKVVLKDRVVDLLPSQKEYKEIHERAKNNIEDLL